MFNDARAALAIDQPQFGKHDGGPGIEEMKQRTNILYSHVARMVPAPQQDGCSGGGCGSCRPPVPVLPK